MKKKNPELFSRPQKYQSERPSDTKTLIFKIIQRNKKKIKHRYQVSMNESRRKEIKFVKGTLYALFQ